MNQSKTGNTPVIALRIDVDFGIGLKKGVPEILSLLSKKNFHGSFFVAMGPDSFGKNKYRLHNKGYKRRLKNMNPLKIFTSFGPLYVLSRLFGVTRDVPSHGISLLKEIVQKNHDLGIHGYDHFWWAENVYTANLQDLKNDLEKAITAFVGLLGFKPSFTGSPNWRTTEDYLRHLEEFNFDFISEARAEKISAIVDKEKLTNYRTPHIPITLPCLHEIADYKDTSNEDIILNEFMLSIKSGLNVWCIHDYYEGILKRSLFERILNELSYRAIDVIKLSDIDITNRRIGKSFLTTRQLPGGRGEISWLESLKS